MFWLGLCLGVCLAIAASFRAMVAWRKACASWREAWASASTNVDVVQENCDKWKELYYKADERAEMYKIFHTDAATECKRAQEACAKAIELANKFKNRHDDPADWWKEGDDG